MRRCSPVAYDSSGRRSFSGMFCRFKEAGS